MRIKSKWGRDVHAEKIVSVVDGKTVFIHPRSALQTHSSGYIAARESQRVLGVSIDNAQKVADHMSEPFTDVKPDDVLVLLCVSDETRIAGLAVLGLYDGQAVPRNRRSAARQHFCNMGRAARQGFSSRSRIAAQGKRAGVSRPKSSRASDGVPICAESLAESLD